MIGKYVCAIVPLTEKEANDASNVWLGKVNELDRGFKSESITFRSL